MVSGHLDGGLRCWDVRSGDRVLDIHLLRLHQGGVTSVHWKPGSRDARTSAIIQTFNDTSFRTLTNHESSSFSPGGLYAAVGRGDNGDVFVWNVASGALEKRLSGAHKCGAVGLAWGRGGTNGQQVATIDKSGFLVLWA